jgi:hypothetical protein
MLFGPWNTAARMLFFPMFDWYCKFVLHPKKSYN